jgi:pyruvate,water dikinase
MLRMLDQLEPQLQTVTRALHQSALPSAVHASLLQLPPHAQWAVRSSATVEDSGAHSFAGQFVSMLSVPAAASNLERAVREVWGSTFKRGVLTYRASLTAELPRMAVIFQPMQPITARERSGVILSRSPVPTMPGVLIQAMFGSGRGVVEGRGGDMYVVSGQEVCVRSLPPSNIKISGATGGEVTAPTPPGLALTTAEARLLATRVSEMADRWGKPVNVEFAWYAQEPEPLFVQIRPITGII